MGAGTCQSCGNGHIAVPCSYPCVCRCRYCGERMDCRGKREPALDRSAYGKLRSRDTRYDYVRQGPYDWNIVEKRP